MMTSLTEKETEFYRLYKQEAEKCHTLETQLNMMKQQLMEMKGLAAIKLNIIFNLNFTLPLWHFVFENSITSFQNQQLTRSWKNFKRLCTGTKSPPLTSRSMIHMTCKISRIKTAPDCSRTFSTVLQEVKS